MRNTAPSNIILTFLPVFVAVLIDGLFVVGMGLEVLFDTAFSAIIALLGSPLLLLALILSGIMLFHANKVDGPRKLALSTFIFVAASFVLVGKSLFV